MYDVIIAGGGIAGLSAALILGRCRRRVLICDSGRPRNGASRALHGFLSRDGIHPMELRRIAARELLAYPSVEFREEEIVDAEANGAGYGVFLKENGRVDGRYLLIATGVVDRLPPLDGLAERYGRTIFHCPYCDGWEVRDQPLAVYGKAQEGLGFALEMTGWSRRVALCTDGSVELSRQQTEQLGRNGIDLWTEPIVRLEGDELLTIVFAGGVKRERRALFFNPAQYQASSLAAKLGCNITAGGDVSAGRFQQVKPRLFVAGDAARSLQMAIVAAAEGAEAAYAINSAMLKEEIR